MPLYIIQAMLFFYSLQMMSTRYVSFIFGIIIASLTWASSLYLYSRLSQNTNTANPTMLVLENSKLGKDSQFYHKTYSNQHLKFHNNLIAHHDKQSMIDKDTYNLRRNAYKNSDKLLQQLQPVPVKPAVTLGQGIFRKPIFILNS